MKVDIYIITEFQGKISLGNGSYAILLETTLNGSTCRKIHIAGWRGLSLQKLATRAAVEAIQYMRTPSEVVIHMDSPYAVNVMKSNKAAGKVHEELWKMYFDAVNNMKSVEVLWEKDHKYKEQMLKQIKSGSYSVVNDR